MHLKAKAYFLFFILVESSLLTINGLAQTIKIKGKLIDAQNQYTINYAIIVDKRTNTGVVCEVDGTFEIPILKEDTILISSFGYGIKKVCFKDSIYREVYTINLSRISYNLQAVTVTPSRNLDEVKKELKKIQTPEADKLKQYDGLWGGLNAMSHPLTYFYTMFSRMERSKRLVEELTNEDNRVELRKALFKTYMFDDYKTLSDRQLDEFIKFCNLSDYMIKNYTEYELCVYIKKKYNQYINQNDYIRVRD